MLAMEGPYPQRPARRLPGNAGDATVDDGAVTGTFTAGEPFPVEIHLDGLR
jgi:hypothetical protein